MTSLKGIMRQVEEKYAMNEIDIIVWSNKIDLLALSNAKGEVALHRLNWQRVWTLPPPVEELRVTALSWRPDGRVLVIAYNNREVCVVDIEKKIVVHKIVTSHDVCFLHWTQESIENVNRYDEYLRSMKDEESGYLLSTSHLNKDATELAIENFRNIKIYSHLNFLLIGLVTGEIQIHVFGLFCCGILNMKQHVQPDSECTILSIDITQNLKSLVVVLNINCNEVVNLQCIIIDTTQLFNRSQDLYTIAYKRGSILNTINNINRSMVNIVEAHEHIVLQEMQMQILEYSKDKEEGTLSAEFMELLLFGFYSVDLATFLQSELTDKKSKKISSSIEVSHSNIQKQIVHHLRPNIEKLILEMSTILGLSRLSYIFSESKLIIEEDLINKSMATSGAFYIKANKVLHILENSSIKYKTFFRWLSSVGAIITNDRTANSSFEVNQREMNFVSDYLCEIDSSTPMSEKDELGQYLTDKDVTYKSDVPIKNLWRRFLADNPCLEECDLIISKLFDNKSLVQMHKYLIESVNQIFKNFTEYIKKDLPVSYQRDFFSSYKKTIDKISVIEAPKQDRILIAYMKLQNNEKLLEILEVQKTDDVYNSKKASMYFQENECGKFDLIDLQFYTHEIISILLDKTDCLHSFCIQLPIESASNFYNYEEPQNVFTIVDKDSLKLIENMKSLKFAVSGLRKVSIIVAEDSHRVRIFEMEADDEEENINNSNNVSGEEPGTSSKLTGSDFSDDDFGSNVNYEDLKVYASGVTGNIADDSDERIYLENSIVDFGDFDVNTLTMASDFTDVDDLITRNNIPSLDVELERDIASLAITSDISLNTTFGVSSNLHDAGSDTENAPNSSPMNIDQA